MSQKEHSASEKIDLNKEAVEIYSTFRLEVEPEHPSVPTSVKAMNELMVIQNTFPSVSSTAILVSMTAWLFVLCFVDDHVDQMEASAGRTLLNDIMAVLAPGAPLPDDLIAEKGFFMNSMRDEDLRAVRQVRHTMSCFLRNVKALLPATTYEALCHDISDVFVAMVDDLRFKKHMNTDLPEYLRIRDSTIGVSPFFTLLRTSLGYVSEPSIALTLLESHITTAVVLQNDLIGLERDIHSGEWMNYGIIYTAYRGSLEDENTATAIGPGISQTVTEHNTAIEVAMDVLESIVEGNSVHDIQVALSVLVFVSRHFSVAKRSERYKVKSTIPDH